MCLYIPNKYEIKKATHPIRVYKEIIFINDNVCQTPYQHYNYIKNKINSVSNFNIIKTSDVEQAFDILECVKIHSYLKNNRDCFKISVGFHFASNKDRLMSLYSLTLKDRIGIFEIPIDSNYIIGIDNELGVSDKIIFEGYADN